MAYPQMNPGIAWSLVKSGFHKTPHFNNMTEKPAAGRGRATIAMMPYPTWDFELDLNYVQGGETLQASVLQWFLGCYMACCGSGGFFLFTDPADSAVENPDGLGDTEQSLMLNVTPGAGVPMGTTGDGVSTQFQLARSIGQGVDILQNVSNVTVFVNGTHVTALTIGPTGVVTFTTAPANNAVLTWQGSFQYLCQFTEDTLKDLARVSRNPNGYLWSCAAVAFESVFV